MVPLLQIGTSSHRCAHRPCGVNQLAKSMTLCSLERAHWSVGRTLNQSQKQTKQTQMVSVSFEQISNTCIFGTKEALCFTLSHGDPGGGISWWWVSMLAYDMLSQWGSTIKYVLSPTATNRHLISWSRSPKTEKVQTCSRLRLNISKLVFCRENDPSCRYGVKHPTFSHSLLQHKLVDSILEACFPLNLQHFSILHK